MSQPNLKNSLTVMKPGRLLDISFAYVFSDESDPTPSPHKPINGGTTLTETYIQDMELLKPSVLSMSHEMSITVLNPIARLPLDSRLENVKHVECLLMTIYSRMLLTFQANNTRYHCLLLFLSLL